MHLLSPSYLNTVASSGCSFLTLRQESSLDSTPNALAIDLTSPGTEEFSTITQSYDSPVYILDKKFSVSAADEQGRSIPLPRLLPNRGDCVKFSQDRAIVPTSPDLENDEYTSGVHLFESIVKLVDIEREYYEKNVYPEILRAAKGRIFKAVVLCLATVVAYNAMGLLVKSSVLLGVALLCCVYRCVGHLSTGKKNELRQRVKEMFLHAYQSYRVHAYPADELMPLTCRGRIRGVDSPRGDIDDALGNFSLTLIDSLDTLFLLNEADEFERAALSVVESVSFDSDFDVSVFETNIRVLGGLLGGHISAIALKKSNASRMTWYEDQLLQMAVDIGNRLLPAFNTSTGIPYPRINLRHGCAGLRRQEMHTCTACGGTMILEFAALSRLTGNPIYEQKAAQAMAYMWKRRNRYSDLVGKVIDVRNGDWIQRESGIGAGIDSYYEYLLKAYILLGEPVYLHRFQTHYNAIKRYIGGPHSADFPFLFLDVNMHRPSERARTFMDSVFAFWPGLQVLNGDVKSAVALHEFLFQVYKRNKLLPEAFTPDLGVHWGQHFLRPEFVESTYLLYQATRDPYYLDVGALIVSDLQKYARVPCGFAAIEDVRTMTHTDRFDSFVLAETFKYLYLLFSEPKDLPVPMDEYVLTTEAHILPLSLSQLRPTAKKPLASDHPFSRNSSSSSPDSMNYHGDRDPVAEAVLHMQGKCPTVDYTYVSLTNVGACEAYVRQSDTSENESTTNTVCSVLDGPGVYRGLWLLSNLTNPRSANITEPVCIKAFNHHLWQTIDLIRQPLRQLATRLNPNGEPTNINQLRQAVGDLPANVRIRAADFRPDDPSQVAQLKRMGIEVSTGEDGRLVVKHDQNKAENPPMALAGLLFIHDVLELARSGHQAEVPKSTIKKHETVLERRHIVVLDPPEFGRLRLESCPAHFGRFPGEPSLSSPDNESSEPVELPPDILHQSDRTWRPLIGNAVVVEPLDGCSSISKLAYAYPSIHLPWTNESNETDWKKLKTERLAEYMAMNSSQMPLAGSIGIVRRGGCMFIDKARNLVEAGAIGGIVMDNVDDTSIAKSMPFTMSGDQDPAKNDLRLPFTLLLAEERDRLLDQMRRRWSEAQKPTLLMLTKDYYPSESLSASLASLSAQQLLPNFPPNGPAGSPSQPTFIFSSEVYSDEQPISERSYRLAVSKNCEFSMSSSPSDVDTITNLETDDSLSCPAFDGVAGTEWMFTLHVEPAALYDYFIPASNGTGGTVMRASEWLIVLEDVLDQTEWNAPCRGVIMTLLEAALSSADGSDMPQAEFALRPVLFIVTCLRRFSERVQFYSILRSIHRASNERVHKLVNISLLLRFHRLQRIDVPM
ncbi:unnamed protein product [Calicophoron daubneyi]|uniref:alpha-1,2-Mannosidase n=1 Tax=Calicophoron daubneyi TaxID=300641 RepID=A0AAV2TDV8_CALDB